MKHLVVCAALISQTTSPAVAPTFDSSRAWEHLRQLVAIGPRPSGSQGIEQSRTYIKNQLKAIGLPVTEQVWEAKTPNGAVRMVNLIVTIPGNRKDSRNKILFTGHYDTKLVRQFRFVGANDAGSSTAFLLELARVLNARQNPLTIELVFLDGEEAVCENWTDCGTPQAPDNTYGSRHFVEIAKRDGSIALIKANVLVDMVAERDLRILRDPNSTPWLTEIIWAAAKRLKHDRTFADGSMAIEDDHLPFLAAGVPSIDLIDLDYAAWHTAQDTLDAVSARSLQIVGDVVLAALPAIEARASK